MSVGRKTCATCGETRLARDFNSSGGSRDGLAAHCGVCVNASRRSRERKKPESGPRRVSIRKASREADVEGVQRYLDSLPEAERAGRYAFVLDHTVSDFRTAPKTARHSELVRWLVERGAVPHPHLVCEASVGGNRELMTTLLDCGAERTLHVAAALGDTEAVQRALADDPSRAGELDPSSDLRLGADHIERGGFTPLHYAARSAAGEANEETAERLAEVARLLLRAGANADALDRSGSEPLRHVASRGGNPRLARVLLEHGADVDQRDESGRTALHWAAQRQSSPGMASLLLEAGAALEPIDASGRSPLDLAIEHGKPKVVAFLRQRGETKVRG